MNNQFDIDSILKRGRILDELEYERCLSADRSLRLMIKENPRLKIKRKDLRSLLSKYEMKNWKDVDSVDEDKVEISDWAESVVLGEKEFINTRKRLIRGKLKRLGLNQQEFGKILGHENKSYISELINGVKPFSLKDIVLISKLLKIDLSKLVPTTVSMSERRKIKSKIEKLEKPQLRFDEKKFVLV